MPLTAHSREREAGTAATPARCLSACIASDARPFRSMRLCRCTLSRLREPGAYLSAAAENRAATAAYGAGQREAIARGSGPISTSAVPRVLRVRVHLRQGVRGRHRELVSHERRPGDQHRRGSGFYARTGWLVSGGLRQCTTLAVPRECPTGRRAAWPRAHRCCGGRGLYVARHRVRRVKRRPATSGLHEAGRVCEGPTGGAKPRLAGGWQTSGLARRATP